MQTRLRKNIMAMTVAICISTPVIAADIPRLSQPVPTQHKMTLNDIWTGFFVGANVGYVQGDTSFSAVEGLRPHRSGAFVGGLHTGHDWRIGTLIVGLTGDYQGTDVRKTFSSPDGSLFTRIDRIGTFRARVGMPFDGFMPYLTGGVGYARNVVRATENEDNTTIRLRKDHFGWVAGAGVEVKIDHGWSVQAEYLYADFGRQMYNEVIVSGADTTEFSMPARPRVNTMRIGINYRF